MSRPTIASTRSWASLSWSKTAVRSSRPMRPIVRRRTRSSCGAAAIALANAKSS